MSTRDEIVKRMWDRQDGRCYLKRRDWRPTRVTDPGHEPGSVADVSDTCGKAVVPRVPDPGQIGFPPSESAL